MSGESYTPPALQGGTETPAGHHSDGHRANGKRFTSIMMDGLHWVRKRLNGPGAMNYAYDSLALAESTPIGAGVRQRHFWASVQTPMFVPSMTVPINGVGGVVHGQTISQPLFDPYNNIYGNIQG